MFSNKHTFVFDSLKFRHNALLMIRKKFSNVLPVTCSCVSRFYLYTSIQVNKLLFPFLIPPSPLTAKLSNTTRENYGPGGVFSIPKLKSLSSAKNCFECGAPFNLFKQKYHCRNCGSIVCSNCSDHRNTLKKFGYENPVRCCDTCEKLIKMQNMNSSELSQLSLKELKEYISAYNLNAKNAIEKNDLVRIIFNTKPISNENECYFRRNRSGRSQQQNQQGSGFSFSNMVQDLFSPSDEWRKEQEERRLQQQRLEQEQRRQREEEQRRNYNMQRQQEIIERRREIQREQERELERERELEKERRKELQKKQQKDEKLLSLQDMIKANIDPASLSVKTLKTILKSNFVEQSHVIEKSELVKLVVRLANQYKAENNSDAGHNDEENLCRICCDAQQNCVFLDCGHMVTCMDCAKKLLESRNECPICREPILKLVHVFRS
ncbi:uncharacterized protein B0P05DRAFT_139570 [Gilbertella persicaria]|uniref:uncharacterized protein n=1 Tax=Gilbertella persicaria TaxID=101096 RepID=UPI00221F2A31|nr:uncharacterized protein B0P05DRAFT_139570 [Gilbertella persicaria]KAI8076458.1 hypothetical protein B0P05DRAFT_139570 [Gilbertella persicaria]